MLMTWKPEEVKRVIELSAEGKSAAQIATFFDGRTRNSIIGLMHRQNIKSTFVRVRKEKPPKVPRLPRVAKVQFARTKRNRSIVKVFDFDKTWPVEHKATGTKKLTELSMFHCRAVIGDVCGAETQFCGEVTVFGKSWCKEHYLKYFRPVEEKDAKAYSGSKRSF